MPFYEIQHSHTLAPSQREELSAHITRLHSTTFNAPSLFVNIRFTSSPESEDFFVGGKRHLGTNRIFVYLRSGEERSNEAFHTLAESIERVWNEVVNGQKEEGISDDGGQAKGKQAKLDAVFIVPGLVAREAGFAIPPAGQEATWLQSHMETFQKRADGDDGDKDFKSLLEEVEDRPELIGKSKKS